MPARERISVIAIAATVAALISAAPIVISWISDRPEITVKDRLTGRNYSYLDFYTNNTCSSQAISTFAGGDGSPSITAINIGEKTAYIDYVTFKNINGDFSVSDVGAFREFRRVNEIEGRAIDWDEEYAEEPLRKGEAFKLLSLTMKLVPGKDSEDRSASANETIKHLNSIIKGKKLSIDIKYNGRYHFYWPENRSSDESEHKEILIILAFATLMIGLFAVYARWPIDKERVL